MFDTDYRDRLVAEAIDRIHIAAYLVQTGQAHTIIYLSGSAIRITRAGHVSLVEAKR